MNSGSCPIPMTRWPARNLTTVWRVSTATALTQGTARVLLLLFLLMIPGIALSIWVLPEAAGPFVIGTLPAITAVTHVGSRLGAQLAVVTGLLGGAAILLQGQPWLAGLFVGVIAGLAGRFARRGLESPVLMVPVVVAYLITEPGKFEVGKTVMPGSWQMAGLTALVLLGGGLWAALLGLLLMRKLPRPPREQVPAADARPYAWAVGIASGLATVVAVLWAPGSSAAWIVLTVILVIRPTRHEMWHKTRDRVLGTIGGGLLAGVVLLTLDFVGAPYGLAVALGLVVLAVGLAAQAHLPYWKYVFIITPGVILLEGTPNSGLALDLARVGFTVAGAILALLVAVAVRETANRISAARAA